MNTDSISKSKYYLNVKVDNKDYKDIKTESILTAIKNMNFKVLEGQFCCLLGPSGCGKTTLLNILSGLDNNYEGNIEFDDGSTLKNASVGYMFQEPRLLPWLTVKENVEIVTQQTKQEKELSSSILENMGLLKNMESFPSQLSGGMQRRVAIARAFVNKPKILLLDEPFISLDITAANLLRSMLINMWLQQKTTIIFVTHDIREAIYLGDRILFLSKGPSKVIYDYKVNLKRPREMENKDIENLRSELMQNHPSIITGVGEKIL